MATTLQSPVLRPTDRSLVGPILLGTTALLVASNLSPMATSELWGLLIVGTVLAALSVPMLRRAGAAVGDEAIRRIVLWGFAAKVAGTIARYLVSFEVYEATDAQAYAEAGRVVLGALRSGTIPLGEGYTSTRFLELLTGFVFLFTGPNVIGAYLVFSWLAFWGLFLFYLAFRTAVPSGNQRRYALLVFLLPSLAFWPSSIGKDAWMVLVLGLCAYGAARIATFDRGGYVPLALGLAGTTLVRPHMTVLFTAGLALAFVIRPRTRPHAERPPMSPFVWAVAIVGLFGLATLSLGQVEERLDPERKQGSGGIEASLDETNRRTSKESGSTFDNVPVRTPLDLPVATVTVLFRPLPTEAHNVQALAASFETIILLFVLWRSRRSLIGIPRTALRNPYLALAAVYVVGFIIAYSNVGNFGILTRQRTQLLPFLAVLLAAPALSAARRDRSRSPVVVAARSSR